MNKLTDIILNFRSKINKFSTTELKQDELYRYKYKFRNYDGEIVECITDKYYYWNKDQFVELELLYKNNCIKVNNKYYSNIVCVEEVEIYDKMIIFYDDELDTMLKIGRCASKEKIEKYNEEIFKKYGGAK